MDFIVTCHGWSASNWVAHALNLHPEIVCTHSARNELAAEKDLQSNQNLKKHLSQLHSGYVNRQQRPMDVTYDEIHAKGNGSAYGSVHVYRLRDLPILNEKYGSPDRSFNIVNLIRNPIDLVWSGYGQFKDLFRYDINELYWTTGKVLETGREFTIQLAEKHDLMLGDYDVLGFLGACAVLGSLRKDLDALETAKKLPYVTYKGEVMMEKVTQDKSTLTDLIDRLANQELTCNQKYTDSVYQTGIINKHKHDSKRLTPEERYNTFTDWQKEAFHYYMNYFNITDPYIAFGYDLSFLK